MNDYRIELHSLVVNFSRQVPLYSVLKVIRKVFPIDSLEECISDVPGYDRAYAVEYMGGKLTLYNCTQPIDTLRLAIQGEKAIEVFTLLTEELPCRFHITHLVAQLLSEYAAVGQQIKDEFMTRFKQADIHHTDTVMSVVKHHGRCPTLFKVYGDGTGSCLSITLHSLNVQQRYDLAKEKTLFDILCHIVDLRPTFAMLYHQHFINEVNRVKTPCIPSMYKQTMAKYHPLANMMPSLFPHLEALADQLPNKWDDIGPLLLRLSTLGEVGERHEYIEKTISKLTF